MKKIDGITYYNTEIRPLIQSLPENDRIVLIENLFISLFTAANSYYDMVSPSQAKNYLMNDMERIKDTILSRINFHKENISNINLEGNPNEKTDRFFVDDAKMDFDKLIREISNIKK